MTNTHSLLETVCRGGVHLGLLVALAVTALGCIPGAAPPAEKLIGKDSAGATVEIVKQESELVRARVMDSTLGIAEAKIVAEDNGEIAFTITFPAGATIIYTGKRVSCAEQGVELIEGTWTQRSSGLFGTDSGAWSVSG